MTQLHTLLLLAALCCVGCASAPEKPGRRAELDPNSPVGTVWHWTALTGTEALSVDKPSRYTLELSPDGRYLVRADCNTGGGRYELAGDGVTIAPGIMSLAACEPASLGDRFSASLGRVATFERDGDRLSLTLDDGVAMQFEAERPFDLAGSSWLVGGYNNGKGGVISVRPRTTLHVEFGEDGTLSGSTGCNEFTGSYELDGDGIALGPPTVTERACSAEDRTEQESQFLAALATASRWRVRGERLEMRRADGPVALSLVAAVTGTISHPTRRTLHPDSRIKIVLLDVSRADAAAVVLGDQELSVAGRSAPIPFRVTFDPADIDPRMSYSVRATITHGDVLLFTSTQSYGVITNGAPRYDIEVQVDPVGS
ncbi:MAG: META domain-containing protein [bacterium]|nr:META domain-containing protein [bacterium]